jgi:hypothetical protein
MRIRQPEPNGSDLANSSTNGKHRECEIILQSGISGIKSKAKRAHITDRQDKNPESPTDTTRYSKAKQAREENISGMK